MIPDGGEKEYQKRFKEVNRRIVRTGVTSYLPTLTSQKKEVYHTVSSFSALLPLVRISGLEDTDQILKHRHFPILVPRAPHVSHQMAPNP